MSIKKFYAISFLFIPAFLTACDEIPVLPQRSAALSPNLRIVVSSASLQRFMPPGLDMREQREQARQVADRIIDEELMASSSPFKAFVAYLQGERISWRQRIPFLDLTDRGAYIDGNWIYNEYISVKLSDFIKAGSSFIWGYDGTGRIFISFVYRCENSHALYIQTYFRRFSDYGFAGNWAPAGNGTLGRNEVDRDDLEQAARLILEGRGLTRLGIQRIFLADLNMIKDAVQKEQNGA
jgi:hypothetical protein